METPTVIGHVENEEDEASVGLKDHDRDGKEKFSSRVAWTKTKTIILIVVILLILALVVIYLIRYGRNQVKPVRPEKEAPMLPPCTTERSSWPPVRLLQIGANDFEYNAMWSSIHGTDDRSQAWLVERWQCPPGIEALLIEPNPPVFKTLQKNVEKYFGHPLPKSIQLAQAAVCANKTGSVPFWVISERFAEDFPNAPHWQKYQLSSFSKEQVLVSKVPEKYVVSIGVPCYSPADTLKIAGFAADTVGVFAVDAEGFDAEIVRAFLDLPDFRPEIIKFECTWIDRDGAGKGCDVNHRSMHEMRESLVNKGYSVPIQSNGDFQAVRSKMSIYRDFFTLNR